MIVREEDILHGHRVRVLLSVILTVLGFSSIALYMGSTIFYPLLQFDEFFSLALHNDIQELLLDRYVGYLPSMIFGIISVIAGNWLWFTKKEIDNSLLAMISMVLFTVFVILMLKTIT